VVHSVGYVRDNADGYASGDGKGEKRCGLHLDCEDTLFCVFCELLFCLAVGRVRAPNPSASYGHAESFQTPQKRISKSSMGNSRAARRQIVVRRAFVADGRSRNHQTWDRDGRGDPPGRRQSQYHLRAGCFQLFGNQGRVGPTDGPRYNPTRCSIHFERLHRCRKQAQDSHGVATPVGSKSRTQTGGTASRRGKPRATRTASSKASGVNAAGAF